MKDPNFTARSLVVDLCLDLVRDGLVVRTWGNVSRRTEGEAFVITPSGRGYETMIESDLALLDGEGEPHGPFKASGEYPMHRLCYQLRPHAQVVVHTHQRYASALSLLGRDIELNESEARVLGQPVIRTARYALPSTKWLHESVHRTLEEFPEDDIFLLEAHGVFLCADSAEQALERARVIEAASERVYREVTGSGLEVRTPRPGELAYSLRGNSDAVSFHTSDGGPAQPSEAQARRHREIYASRKNVGAILLSRDSEVAEAAKWVASGEALRPYLDDFAQLVGVRADASAKHNVTFPRSGETGEAGVTGVAPTGANTLVGEDQERDVALCLGKDLHEAEAVDSVLRKNARAARVAKVAGRDPIKTWECYLMNIVYKLKYSKQSG